MMKTDIGGLGKKTRVALAVGACVVGIAHTAHADMDSARQALSGNDYPAAISALDEVLQQSPGNQEARFLKGLALARSGDIDDSIEVFNALVKDNPNMAEAWNNLGVIRARSGDLTGARDALQQATRVDPEHGPAQENLGDIYVALARDAYSRAGELESDNAIARAKGQQLAFFLSDNQGDQQGGVAAPAAESKTRVATPPPAADVAEADNASQGAGQSPVQAKAAPATLATDDGTPQAALQRWADAWTMQDVTGYLAVYSDAFVPDNGQSRSAWAAARRERVGAPARIDLELSKVAIARRGEQALVEFNQEYRSNTYRDRMRKALLMTRGADGWQILREGEAGSVDFTIPPESANSAGSASSSERGKSRPAPSATPSRDTANTDMSSSTRLPDEAADKMTATSPETAAKAPSNAIRQAIRDALQDWADAWSAQNIQGYLNAYSDNYRPRTGASLADWVRERKKAIADPAWVKVRISDVQVDVLDPGRAQASFNQTYESSNHEDRERKRVTLIAEDGGWRIVRES